MPELVTITRQRSRPPSWPARIWQSVRATWTGPWSAKDPALANLFSDGARSAAGITVTPEVAFTYSAVYDAVNQIASDVAKMPLNLMKRLPNGGSVPYVDSKLYRILKHQPNPEMGSMVMRRQLTAWALTSHGGFAEIQRDALGRPAALWPIEPHRVTVKRGRLRGADGHVRDSDLYYEVDGGATEIPPEDMLHLQGLGYTPHEPYGVINKARQAIGLALAAERFGATFFGNGSTFGGILTTDSMLNPEEAKALREVVESIHQGPDRAHKLALFWGGLKFQQLGVKPNEAQMNELRDKQIEEVARFFRIPPHRLGLNKPGTVSYASVEMANLDYYTGCLLDWITLWEEECNRKLIPAIEYKLQFVKHNANVFLRADFEKRMAGFAMALDKGLYSRNEVRAFEDMGPQDGEQGDWYLVQSAQVPLHMLQDVTEASMSPDPEPPAPVPPPEPDDDEAVRVMTEAIRGLEAKIVELTEARAEAAARDEADRSGQVSMLTDRIEALVRSQATVQAALEIATASAATAEAAVEAEREAREALEAERETLRQEAESARASLAETTAELEARQASLAEAEAAREEQVRVADEAVQALAVIQARLDAATGDEARAVIEAERQAAQALVEEASAAATVAREEADAARAEAERAALAVTEAEAARDAAQARADASGAALMAAEAEAESVRQARDAALAQAAALEAETARVQAESAATSEAGAAAVEAAETRVAEAEAAADAARAAAAEAATQVQASEAERAAALAEAERVQAEAAEQIRSAEQALAEARQAVKSRDAALLAASRGLIVEAVGVLVRRECAQARSKQATPQKVRTWLKGMAVLHEPVCVERLVGPLRLHLALTNRGEDAEAVAAQMAAAHLAEFRRQVEAVLEVDADEFHVALERMLTRWETERPAAVADALLVEGIRHVA